jgi:hypothetical protein
MLVMYFVLEVSMLVMYLCIRGFDVGHKFGVRVSMLVIYLCVSGIDVDHVFVC